ncbi:hypothetical protein ACLOJK_031501 [Asimina triloba]
MEGASESRLSHTAAFLFFLFFRAISASERNPAMSPYNPAEVILLSCGEHSQTEDGNGRIWKGDVEAGFLASDKTITSTADSQTSVPQVPYMTARIFTSKATYVFPVSDGWKFVRLYFYPANYNHFVASSALFSVSSGRYTLLHNFSSYITSQAQNLDYLIHEFSIYAKNGFLNLTFSPSPHVSNAYGFVNGIEIVSTLNIFSEPARAVLDGRMPPQTYRVLNESALQTVVRLNVGGRYISPVEDSGLFRAWYDDSQYIYGAAFGVTFSSHLNKSIEYTAAVPPYMAPYEVYETARSMGPSPFINQNYNLTWIFPIDAGFNYMVRLHFCEILPIIYKENQRVFKIFLHNQTAETEADVITWGDKKNGVAVYRDYFVLMSYDASPELWVALYPNVATGTEYVDAILNGIEIFKLSAYDGNLARSNPVLPSDIAVNTGPVYRSAPPRNSKNGKLVAILVGVVAIASLVYVAFITFSRWAYGSDAQRLPFTQFNQGRNKKEGQIATSKRGRPFSFAEMKMAGDDHDGVDRHSTAHEDSEEHSQSQGAVFPYMMEVRGR